MCNDNIIKRVIGVTRTFEWTITTGGEAVDLDDRDLSLVIVAAKGGEQEIEFTTDANVLTFTWQGTAQTRIDRYSIILWENLDEDSQRRVDIHNFVELVPWVEDEDGSYSDLTDETVDLGTSDFTDETTSSVVVVDSLTSTSTTAALSANMGRELNETKQDLLTFDDTPTEDSTNPVYSGGVYDALTAKEDALSYYTEDTASETVTLSTGDASIVLDESDAGTVVITATNTDISNGNGDQIIVGSQGVTVTSDSFTYNSNEVATVADLEAYYTQTETDTLLAAKQDTLTFDSTPTSGSDNPVTSDGIYDAIVGKQDILNFDALPETGSTNPVYSGGIVTYVAAQLDTKQDLLTFDTTPTTGSTNPVTSSGVATALEDKQDELTFDDTPTSGSDNPVTSDGIYSAIAAVSNATTIVSVASGTTALTAETGNYYLFADEVSSLTITLPTITGATSTQSCVFMLTTASTTSVTITSGSTIYYFDGYSIDAATTYELNALWNGSQWVVAYAVIATS